jgi:hypothetical protein
VATVAHRAVRTGSAAHAARAVAGAAVLAGAAYRLALLPTPLANLNGDEAVTGLMARDIGRGHGYVFFAGQHYMGALEQYVQAPFVRLVADPETALRLPVVLASSLAIWLVYVIGRDLLHCPWRGVLAAWLFAVGSPYVVYDGTKSNGAYNAALVLSLLAVKLAMDRRRPFLLGLTAGAALWCSVVATYLLVPAFLLARPRRPAVAVGLVLGYAPAWVWALVHRRLPFATIESRSSAWERFRGLVAHVLPEHLGLQWQGGTPIAPAFVTAAVVGALAGGLAGRPGPAPAPRRPRPPAGR